MKYAQGGLREIIFVYGSYILKCDKKSEIIFCIKCPVGNICSDVCVSPCVFCDCLHKPIEIKKKIPDQKRHNPQHEEPLTTLSSTCRFSSRRTVTYFS